jgi:hypothetical protein
VSDQPTLDAARERAIAARSEFHGAAGELFGWLSPARLKAEAAMAATQQIDGAKAALRRQVRSHPLVSWSALAILATLLTYVLRRPATALGKSGVETVRALYHRITRRKA